MRRIKGNNGSLMANRFVSLTFHSIHIYKQESVSHTKFPHSNIALGVIVLNLLQAIEKQISTQKYFNLVIKFFLRFVIVFIKYVLFLSFQLNDAFVEASGYIRKPVRWAAVGSY